MDYSDTTAVCDRFARTLLTVDTASDRSGAEALARTAPYATAGLLLAAAVNDGEPRWHEWASHRAHTDVVTSAYAGDAGGADDRPRAARLATVTPLGRDGWRGPVTSYAVHCVMTPVGDGVFRVVEYELEPLGL